MKHAKIKRGRPSLPKAERKESVNLTIRMPADLRSRLDAKAAAVGKSLAEMILPALEMIAQ